MAPNASKPSLDILDETFIVASAGTLCRELCDERTWAGWFPGLELTLVHDREELGKRWTVSGVLSGSAEVWLERWADGVIVHVFLQADPASDTNRRAGARLADTYRLGIKERVTQVKDRLECDRRPGMPATPRR